MGKVNGLFRCFGFWVVFWIVVFVWGDCFVFGIIVLVLGGALCFADLKGLILRRVEKWGEGVGGSMGCEVWG